MRTTLTLTVNEEVAQFIQNQQGLVDPSALVNQLIHEDMERRGFRVDPGVRSRVQKDDVTQALERHLDENTHAAD